MTDNSTETGPISMNDAISLLSTPEVDTAAEEQVVLEEPQQPEEETLELSEETAEAPEESYEEDESDEGEDAYEDEAELEEYEQDPDDLYTVKIDGEEHSVTLDELQKGYSRQQAFTKRSMELAEQRKAFESEQAQVQQLRDAYKQQLDQWSAVNQQTFQQEPDWAALAQTMDASDLVVAKAQWDQEKAAATQVEAERQRLSEQQMQEQGQKMQQHLAAQREQMLERLPQWRDEDVRDAERQEVIKYAQRRIGFSEEEIANASDARAIELLYKAWKWDNLQEKKPVAKKRTQKAPKMSKSGKPTTKKQVATRQRQKSLDRLSSEGSIDAAVKYLMGQ